MTEKGAEEQVLAMERLRSDTVRAAELLVPVECKRLKFSHSKKSTGYFSVAGVP